MQCTRLWLLFVQPTYPSTRAEQELFGNDTQFLGNGTPPVPSANERENLLQEKRTAYEQAKAEVGARTSDLCAHA